MVPTGGWGSGLYQQRVLQESGGERSESSLGKLRRAILKECAGNCPVSTDLVCWTLMPVRTGTKPELVVSDCLGWLPAGPESCSALLA